MVEYNKVNVKLLDSELHKLKTTVKNYTGAPLGMNIYMFSGNNLPHELLTTRKTFKWRHAFENNMSTDIKLSRVLISNIIQSERF